MEDLTIDVKFTPTKNSYLFAATSKKSSQATQPISIQRISHRLQITNQWHERHSSSALTRNRSTDFPCGSWQVVQFIVLLYNGNCFGISMVGLVLTEWSNSLACKVWHRRHIPGSSETKPALLLLGEELLWHTSQVGWAAFTGKDKKKLASNSPVTPRICWDIFILEIIKTNPPYGYYTYAQRLTLVTWYIKHIIAL